MALEVLRVSFTAVVLIGVLTNLGIEFHADVLLDRIVMKLSILITPCIQLITPCWSYKFYITALLVFLYYTSSHPVVSRLWLLSHILALSVT